LGNASVFYSFYLVYIWHCRIKLFLRHLPNKKANDYENFEKGMIYMKILKKGGSREKGGGGNEIHAPCACDSYVISAVHNIRGKSPVMSKYFVWSLRV
jgi:hypothetical protein